MAEGFGLVIPDDLLTKLQEVDTKVAKIAETSKNTASVFTNSFSQMAKGGANPLADALDKIISKQSQLGSISSSVGEVGKSMEQSADSAKGLSTSIAQAADNINKLSTGSNGVQSSVDAWQNIQKEINDVTARQKELTDYTRQYEMELANINSGKGGTVNTTQYNTAKDEIQQNSELLTSLRSRQQAVIDNVQAYRQLDEVQKSLRTYKDDSQSLAIQRSNEELKQMNAYYKELEVTSAKEGKAREKIEQQVSATVEREVQKEKDSYLSSLNEKIRAAQQYQARQEAITKLQNQSQLNTYSGSMAYASNAGSINERAQATKYLTAARNAENTTTAEGTARVAELNAKIKEMNSLNKQSIAGSKELVSTHRNLMDTTSQLTRQFALLFSVSAITGYMNKLVSVRGEFEMQQVALEAIIQDKDKADVLFGQITQLAVMSPFRVKDLVTYTKELAAYRIENDKLFDTTKRLADVSAGLGVDMDRLILAYGQVKAASFLRGQEVRQFTEAGINLYAELAKHFTAIKGQAVSVADVVEMIPKRMVKFEDVAAVFENLTNKGGIFYNMQEKQSYTLQGQVSNMKDKIDLMLNDIGKSNQGVMTSIISVASYFIENWRSVAAVLETVVTAYASYKAVLLATSAIQGVATLAEKVGLTTKMASVVATEAQSASNIAYTATSVTATGAVIAETAATDAAKVSQAALNTTIAMNPYALALAAVMALGVAMYEVWDNATHLDRALKDINAEGYTNAFEMSNNYKNLANTVADSTKSYNEHKAALQELQQTYSEILPAQMLNEKGIISMRGNYDAATAAIYNYINAKTKEKEIDEVTSELGGKLTRSQERLAQSYADQINSIYGVKLKVSDIQPALAKLREEMDKGTVTNVNAGKELQKLIQYTTGFNVATNDFKNKGFGAVDISTNLQDLISSYNTYNEKINQINSDSVTQFGSSIVKKLDKTKAVYQGYANEAAKALDVLKQKAASPSSVSTKEVEIAGDKIVEMYGKLGIKISDKNAYIKSLLNNSFKIDDETVRVNQTAIKKVYDLITSVKYPKSEIGSVNLWAQQLNKAFWSINPDPLHRAVQKMIIEFGIMNKLNLNGLVSYMIQANESVSDYAKRMGDTATELRKKLSFNSMVGSLSYGKMSKQQIDDTKKQIKLLDALNKSTDTSDKAYQSRLKSEEKARKDREKADKAAQKVQRDFQAEQISALKDMNSEYEKYLEFEGADLAKKDVLREFSRTMSYVKMPKNISENFVPTKEGLLAAYEKILPTIKDLKKKLDLSRQIGSLQVEIKTDAAEKRTKEFKDKVQKELDSLKLNQELLGLGLTQTEIDAMFKGVTKNLSDVENELSKIDRSKLGKKELEAVKDTEKEISKMKVDEAFKTFEYLVKTYKNTMSSQLEIDIWYADERSKILSNPNLQSDTGKAEQQTMLANLDKMRNQKTSENAFNQLKGSDMYVTLFDNMEYASTKSLERIKAKLAELKDSFKTLSPEKLKVVTEEYNKLTAELDKRAPFAAFIESFKKVEELRKQGKSESNLDEQLVQYTTENDALQQQMDDIGALINIKEKGLSIDYLSADTQKRLGNLTKEPLLVLGQILQVKQQIKTANDKEIASVQEGLGAYKEERQRAKELSSYMEELSSKVQNIFEGLKKLYTTMGGEEDDLTAMWMDVGSAIVSAIFQTIIFAAQLKAAGVAANSALGIIGWIAIALTAITSVLATILGNSDKKKQKEIENLQKQVQQLQRAYTNLKDAMDKAYDTTSLVKYREEMERNLDTQVASYQAMINAEKAKKHTDEGKIQEWQNAIDDIDKSRKELNDTMLQDLGGIGDNVKSTAEEFVDAWVDAFYETGDGLDSLTGKFDDLFKNALKKQLTYQVTSSYLAPLFKQLDSYFGADSEGGVKLTPREMQSWQESANIAKNGVNDYLSSTMQMLKDMGIDLSTSSSELSGLQQGIQNITEAQAASMESMLNSIRFFVSQQTSDISAIRSLLANFVGSSSSQNGGDNNTLVLNELKAQTALINSINNSFISVIKQGHSMGGAGIKVFM